MKLEQAARQALEALIEANVVSERYQNAEKREQAITALQEALAEQAEQEPEYDLSNVIHLTHNKAKHIIESRGYFVTGFVLTREDGGKCIVDMSAVRWFDDKLVFQRMMHSDTPKEWLSLPVELVKQESVGEVRWYERQSFGLNTEMVCDAELEVDLPEGTKLYDTPVRTKDLTDDEIDRIACNVSHKEFARAVIAADREKNK